MSQIFEIGNSVLIRCLDQNIIAAKIPDDVTSIGYCAFQNCYNLMSVSISNSVTSIGNWAFQNCINLISVNIPNNITYIGENAFKGCNQLRNLVINNEKYDVKMVHGRLITLDNLKEIKIEKGTIKIIKRNIIINKTRETLSPKNIHDFIKKHIKSK